LQPAEVTVTGAGGGGVTAVTRAPGDLVRAAWERQLAEARHHASGQAAGQDRTYFPRCPHCKGKPLLGGATVSIAHAPGCIRANAAARLARAAASRRAGPARVQAAAAAVPAVPPAVDGPARQQEPAPTPPGSGEGRALRRAGIRPWVVLRWLVAGCRVKVGGWLATVRGIIRPADHRLKVRVEFDDGWAPEDCFIWADPDDGWLVDFTPAWAA
jgi:hypothetical protein